MMFVVGCSPDPYGFSHTPSQVVDCPIGTEKVESSGTEIAQVPLLSEIAAVAQECREPGWDGYGAEPVSLGTYRLAHRLALGLPDALPIPSVGAEPDGSLTLDWYRDPSHVLSLSVAPDGRTYFAANIGSRRRAGSDDFTGLLPAEVVDLINAILPA